MSSTKNSLAMQRIAKLLDENSFVELGSLVTARSTDFNLTADKTPSDGVIVGHGLIDENLVFVYSQDASVLGGTIGEMHAKKIASVYDMAMKMGAPVIGLFRLCGCPFTGICRCIGRNGSDLCKTDSSFRCCTTDQCRIRQLWRWTCRCIRIM